MDDQISNLQNTSNSTNQPLSPWEEDLDVQEEVPKPRIVGSLIPNTNNSVRQPAVDTPIESFNMPSNPGMVQSPVSPVVPSIPTSPQSPVASGANIPMPAAAQSIPIPTPVPSAVTQSTVTSTETSAQNSSFEPALEYTYDVPQSPPEVVTNEAPVVTTPRVMDIRPAFAPPPQESSQQQTVNPAPGGISDIVAPSTVENQNLGVEVKMPEKPVLPPVVENVQSREKINIQTPGRQVSSMPRRHAVFSGKMMIISSLSLALILLVLSIFLTEKGIISIGAEKIYGKAGIQALWGGLSLDSGQSLARSFAVMSEAKGYDINGTISLRVDKNTNSSTVKPLLPQEDNTVSSAPIKAILASTEDQSDSAYTDYYVESSDSISTDEETDQSSTSDGSTDTSADTITSDSTTITSDSTDQSTATDYNSNYTDGTGSSQDAQDQQSGELNSTYPSTVNMEAELTGIISKDGSDITFTIGQPQEKGDVHLINIDDKLFVSSSKVLFDKNSKTNKWQKYTIESLNNKNLYSELFNLNPESGLSVTGTRVGNEKLGSERVYHYKIDKMEIGDSLSAIGITSDMVQNITGEAWIGINDKIAKKINLKITTASSYPVSTIQISLNFSPSSNATIDEPNASDLVEADGSTTADEAASITPSAAANTQPAVSTPVVVPTSDEKRKSDLVAIKTALESYHAKFSKYPVAASTIKLDQTGNVVEKSVVPAYASALPRDPKASEGWYYGYKSNGNTFMLSARLEDTSDSQGKVVGDIYLYFVYNE